jgi:hypothetical protein
MNLFLDVNTNKFVTSPDDSTPVLSINTTRGDTIPFEVGFVQNCSLLTMSGYNFSIGFKQGGLQNFSGAYLAYANSFSVDTSQPYSPLYSTYLSFANTGLDSLFSGVSPVKLVGQLSYGISGLTEISSFSLTANVYDDINKPSGSYPDNSFVFFPSFVTGAGGIETTLSGNTVIVSNSVTGVSGPANYFGYAGSTVTGSETIVDGLGINQGVRTNRVTVSGSAAAYTGLFSLSTGNAFAGAILKYVVYLPDSTGCNIAFQNAGATGNLVVQPGVSGGANTYIEFGFDGSHWQLNQWM